MRYGFDENVRSDVGLIGEDQAHFADVSVTVRSCVSKVKLVALARWARFGNAIGSRGNRNQVLGDAGMKI